MKPVEQVSAWLFRVASNRITDLFRKKRPELLGETVRGNEDGNECGRWRSCFPLPMQGRRRSMRGAC